MKPQISISVASDEGTINPIICRVPSGRSFKFLSQTMAGHIPTEPLPDFPERQRQNTGPNWPLVANTLGFTSNDLSKEGAWEPSQGPEAQRWKICLLQKLSKRQLWSGAGTGLETGNPGFRSQRCHVSFLTLATHQVL